MAQLIAVEVSAATIRHMQSVSDQIRSALVAAPTSITEIARLTGIHRVNLQQFKGGKRDLPLKSLEILADHLGLKIVAVSKSSRPSKKSD